MNIGATNNGVTIGASNTKLVRFCTMLSKINWPNIKKIIVIKLEKIIDELNRFPKIEYATFAAAIPKNNTFPPIIYETAVKQDDMKIISKFNDFTFSPNCSAIIVSVITTLNLGERRKHHTIRNRKTA